MWKWAIIALHNALQGAMVCHLSGSTNLGALDAKNSIDIYARIQIDWVGDPKISDPKLASIGVLFERVTTGQQTDKNGHLVDWLKDARQSPISVDATTKDAFKLITDLRNGFVHFTPKGWSIEIAGLSSAFASLAGFIQKIRNNGYAFRHLSSEQTTDLDAYLNELSAEITRMD